MKTKSTASVELPIWKTVSLGTALKTALYFIAALDEMACRLEWWGEDLLGYMPISNTPRSMPLVLVTGKSLGLSGKAFGLSHDLVTLEGVYRKAAEVGLEPCPAEVGPQLRLSYHDQPVGETIYVGMEPIQGSNEYPAIFVVSRASRSKDMSPLDSMCVESRVSDAGTAENSQVTLDGTYGMEGRVWRRDALWVFAKSQT